MRYSSGAFIVTFEHVWVAGNYCTMAGWVNVIYT